MMQTLNEGELRLERRITVRSANWLLFFVILLQIVMGMVISLYINETRQPFSVNFTLLLGELFSVLLPIVFYLRLKKIKIVEVLRLRPIGYGQVALVIVIGLSVQFIAQMLNIPILFLLSLFGEIPPSPIEIPHTISGLLIAVGMIAVVPAILEEILVRGIMMKAYEIRGTKTGIIISALFFGLIHLDIKNLIGPIAFGMIFGYIVLRTGSIFAGIIAHFSNNAFALILEYLQENYSQRLSFMNTIGFMIVAFIFSAMVFVLALRTLNRATKWTMVPSIDTVKSDLQAAFFNWPLMLSTIIYIIFVFAEFVEILKTK